MPSSLLRRSANGTPVSRLRHWGGAVIFGAWFAATSLLGAWTVAQHLLPLPAARPADVPSDDRPQAWYVLGSDCGCSASVADELTQRGPQRGWREQVWLVGDEPAMAAQLQQAGFTVERIAAEKLATTHRIQGAPWLVLFAADGRTAYSGGYSRGRPGVAGNSSELADLMNAVVAGRSAETLPAYGCATSQALRSRLDPLNLRFSAQQ